MSGVEPIPDLQRNLREPETKPSLKEARRRVAAIDVGTNSTHLLIASVDARLHTFNVDLAEKSTTRLGERDSESGDLTEKAIQRTLETLKRFKELSIGYRVEQLVIAATSAVREAPNGSAFIGLIKEDLGLDVELISGPEEARLIYLGVLSGTSFGDRPHLLIDIGGGSTEITLADSRDAKALTSTRIGAVRLQRDFFYDDPLPPKRVEFLKTFIQGSLEPAINKIISRMRPRGNPVMIATSGTALAIGSLAIADTSSDKANIKLHGYKVSKSLLDGLIQKLLVLSPEQRRKLPSISDRRSEIILPGAMILQMTMEMIGFNEVVLSERALREGLVVDWMLRKGLLEDRFSLQGSIRQRTVLHQAERFGVNTPRSEYAANLALDIYDKSKGALHSDHGPGRELLWAAAMLHTCGQHINMSSYHKHSWYLIRHGELLGYSQAEHLMVAAIARYHRKSLPRKRHEAWNALINKEDRQTVSEMSLILRLATSINLRLDPVVSSVEVEKSSASIAIKLIPEKLDQNLSLEEWSLRNCSFIVKELTGYDLKILKNKKN